MGQQSLLLLVFGIVIVGAVVVAGAYGVQEQRALQGRHLAVQEVLEIVADLQTWKQKPAMLGGGEGRHGFTNVTFRTLSYAHTLLSNRVYKTEFGCYTLRVYGPHQEAEVSFASPSCARSDFVARVIISGTGPADLAWHHNPPPPFEILP